LSTSSSTVTIVTDSTADLPADVAESLGIFVVPALLIIEEETYRDGEGMTREEFYELLPRLPQNPTTAAPSPQAFAEAYERALTSGARQVLSIHISAKLSGMINAASQAADEFPGQVEVFDSRQVSMGLGFQVMRAARIARRSGDWSGVTAAAREAREHARLVAMIDTLEYLRRSGRVSWIQAGVGGLLKVKLMVEIKDGSVENIGRVRTRSKALQGLKEYAQSIAPLSHLAVLHTAAGEQARAFADELVEFSASPPIVAEATTVIGTHVGPNAIGIAALKA
jgi:DegV family protein with EDD domain